VRQCVLAWVSGFRQGPFDLSDVFFQPVDFGAVNIRSQYSVHLFLDRRSSDLLIETSEVGDKPLSHFEQFCMTLGWLRHGIHEFVFSFIVHNGLHSAAVAAPLDARRIQTVNRYGIVSI